MSDNIHRIQAAIIKKLIFTPKLRYTDLRPSESVDNNKLNFHLAQLKEAGLIMKDEEFYSLTSSGKAYAANFDTFKQKPRTQAKLSVAICAMRNTSNEIEYLIYTRLKAPFYGCQGFLSGKIEFGETAADAASRELEEETGLIGEPEIIELKHYLVYGQDKNHLLEDKFMFLCVVRNPIGELVPSDEGKYEWVKESDLKSYVTNHFESWESFAAQINQIKNRSKDFTFQEVDHISEKF